MPVDEVIKELDTTLLHYQDLVKQHNQAPSLTWCMNTQSSYHSSYYNLNTFGSTHVYRTLNYLFGGYISFYKDRFISQITSTLRQRYYLPLKNLSFNIPDDSLSLFINHLDNLLFSHWKAICNWSFAELFSFLNQSCIIFNSHLELPVDLYKSEKKIQLQRCLAMIELIKEEAPNGLPLESLCFLAIKANWIDSYLDKTVIDTFLAHFPEELNQILDENIPLTDFMTHNPFINYSSLLYLAKGSPKRILYELDNQGEALFDLLLIEHFLNKGHAITLVTKQKPILNDVTYDDLKTILCLPEFKTLEPYQQSKQLTIISHGSSDVIPLRYCMNEAYIDHYTQSDMVIMKGQGNFESYPLRHMLPILKKQLSYKKNHCHLFVLKSALSQRSFQTIVKSCPLKTLICYSTAGFN